MMTMAQHQAQSLSPPLSWPVCLVCLFVSLPFICWLGILISAWGYPQKAEEDLANHIHKPWFVELLGRFLYDQVHPNTAISSANAFLNDKCPLFVGTIFVFHSAVACFYALSNFCGAGGMRHEWIRSNPSWWGMYDCYDTMLVETNAELDGMPGLPIGHTRLLFSFRFRDCTHACVLVDRFNSYKEPDDITGM